MKIRTRVSHSELYCSIYILLLEILTFFAVISSSLFTDLVNISYGKISLACCLIAAVLILPKKSSKELVLFFAFGLLIGCTVYLINKSTFFLCFIVFWYAAQWIPYNKILKAVLFSLITGVILVVAMDFLGLFPQIVYYRDDGMARMSFGFLHPNTFSLFVLAMVTSYYFLRNEQVRWYDIIPGGGVDFT